MLSTDSGGLVPEVRRAGTWPTSGTRRAESADNTSGLLAVFLTLLALAIPVFFVFLGANSIWDANEAFYVETPRQMIHSGDYLNPSFNGLPRFNKPVLSYWIVAALYHAFGESVTVERVGIAIGAVGIVLAAFLIGRAVQSSLTGVLGALVVATAPRMIWFARRIFIDVYLTLFTSLALACFLLADRHPAQRRRYLLLMYVALGLGVLTKGPVAVALPALVTGIWLALERRIGDLKRLMLLPGALIILAIVTPWYAADYHAHGWVHIEQFLLGDNLARYATQAMTPGGRGPLFYVGVLVGDLFPWAPLVVVPLISIVLAWRSPVCRAAPGAAARRLLWLWIVVFVAVFSFSRTKEDLYIFPTVPAVAVLVADSLVRSFVAAAPRALSPLFLLLASLLVVLAPALFWLFGPSAGYYALPGTAGFAAVMAATGLAAFFLWARTRRAQAVVALAAGFIVLNYVFVGLVLPGVERSKPVVPLARTLAERAAPGAKVGYFNMGLQSFVYYTNRTAIEEIGILDQAYAFFYDQRESWALMGVKEWTAVHALVPNTCVVDRHPLSIFDAPFGDVLSRIPPTEVLLVKNNCGQH